MKPGARRILGRCLLAVVLLAAAIIPLAIGHYSNSTATSPYDRLNNNPSRFYLSGNSNSQQHWITYDPRAADTWLFRSAMAASNPPALQTNIATRNK